MDNNERNLTEAEELKVQEENTEASEEVAELNEETAPETAEVIEAAEEQVPEIEEAAQEEADETPAMKASTAAKREKKAARRDEKAARKAANQIEEKKSRPNNLLLAIMIFGVLILMFVFVKGYNYFSMDPSIEKYIENNGGEETFGSMAIDQYTNANITAEGNSLKIELNTTVEDDEQVDSLKEFYGGDDWEDQMKYIGAYFLTSMKNQTRGFSGDVTVVSNVNGEEVKSISLTLKEAKEEMEPDEEETDADAEAEDEGEADESDAEDDAEESAEGDD